MPDEKKQLIKQMPSRVEDLSPLVQSLAQKHSKFESKAF